MDPASIVGAGLTVLASKDLLNRLLGPTADYLGEGTRNLAERCAFNLNRVFKIAIGKLGDRISKPGSVSPRVLRHIIDEASFCESEVVAEYLGGVLASARTEAGRDDRAVSVISEIKSLSSYQLRSHYLLYSAIIAHGNPGHPGNISPENWYEAQNSITIVFSDASYEHAMDYSEGEDHLQIAREAFIGLQAKGLSQKGTDAFSADTPSHISEIDQAFRFIWPTPYGNELFAWGLGIGGTSLRSYFDISPDHLQHVNKHDGIHVLSLEWGNVSLGGGTVLK